MNGISIEYIQPRDSYFMDNNRRATNGSAIIETATNGSAQVNACLDDARDAAMGAQFLGIRYEETLTRAARSGNSILCIFALESGATNVDDAFFIARFGDLSVCDRARTKGARDFALMMKCAAFGGYCDLCEFADQWISEYPAITIPISANEPERYVRACAAAARGGHRETCEWAYARMRAMANQIASPCPLTEVLAQAARGGHRDICNLVHKWAREDGEILCYEPMFYQAARHNLREFCDLARMWSYEDGERLDYTIIMPQAAHDGDDEIRYYDARY